MSAPTRSDIINEARRWIGTPYHHQASLIGVGTDCIGLVRGIWRAFYGAEPEKMPAYPRDWGDANGREDILAVATRHLIPVARGEPGDVLCIRWKHGGVAKHVMIKSGPDLAIHAFNGAAVCEIPLGPFWTKRTCAAFAFPGVR